MAEVSEPLKSDLDQFRELVRRGAAGPHHYVVLLGLRTYDVPHLLRRIQKGFSFNAFERLQRNMSVSDEELGELVQVPPRTLARRKQESRFSPEESDRLLRVARLFARALELFEGEAEGARAWLGKPQPALGGAIPLSFARTDLGAREVEAVIGRLEQGVYS